MNETWLSRRFAVRHRSLTRPSENCPLPAPMTLILTDLAKAISLGFLEGARACAGSTHSLICGYSLQTQFLSPVATHHVPRSQLAQRRRLDLASLNSVRTSRVEIATAGRIRWVGDLATQRVRPGLAGTPSATMGIGTWHRRQQRLGVGMERLQVQLIGVGHLD